MSDEPYINLDLDTAEKLLFAAGKPELAKALHFHANGVRNLVQGEWGQSFVNSLEGLLSRHIEPLVEGQKETHSGIAALSGQFRALAEDVTRLDKRDAAQYAETQRLFRESQARQEQLAKELGAIRKSFEEYRAGSRRDEVDQLLAFKSDIEARIARALPEDETQQLIGLLRQIAAERGGDGE